MSGRRGADLLWRAFALAVLVFMVTPILLVVIFSFNRSALTSLPLTGFTLDWYRRLLANGSFWPALENSLVVGVAVALGSVVTGTLAAFALSRLPARLASALASLISIPMMLPALILGIALVCFFVRFLAVPLGLGTVILGQMVVAQPFVLLIVFARLATLDWSVVDSARDLGASPMRAFVTVTLPIIRPTVIGAALIAVALSVDDFVITFFTIGSGNTLPTFVWGMIRTALTPAANAIGTLILGMTVGSTLLALWLTRYRG